MKILFGMKLDGAVWSYDKTSVGSVTYGPMGMLDWLEKTLGLSGVYPSEPERIKEYQEKIKESDAEWCRKSFNLDSWSTAIKLLSWRDELVLNGWNKTDGPSKRLSTLSFIENSPTALSPGIPDRLLSVIAEAQSASFDASIVLVDNRADLPYLWKEVINTLEKRGAVISGYVPSEPCRPKITTVIGENEITLARDLARYLSAADCSSTALIVQDDTSVLDGIFHRYGIAAVGSQTSSKWRESLQILPLWLKTLWKPFNAKEFIQLLKLPLSPIPYVLRSRLSEAVKKAPGYGGEEWDKAWKGAEEEIRKKYPEDYQTRLDKLEEMRNLLDKNSFYAIDKVSGRAVIERCDIMRRNLAPYAADNIEAAVSISEAGMLSLLIDEKKELTEIELWRILESVISNGTCGGYYIPEHTPFDVYKDPQMIMKDYDNIIWWNCVSRKENGAVNWTKGEESVLPEYNRSALRMIESASWHNAPSRCRKNLICLIPKVLNGEPSFPHPLLDEYNECDIERKTGLDLVDESGVWHLLDISMKLKRRNFFKPVVLNKFDGDSFTPERLSYSSLGDFIACPVKWMLNYHIGLERADSLDVPEGSQMIGTLAHKVVENIYRERKVLSEEEAERLAEKEYDTLLPQMASQLLSDSNNVERLRTKNLLVSSVKNLVREINRRSLKVCANEMKLSGEFEGVPFTGYSDIVLEDGDGNKFVIDMKWSFNKAYREHYENDEALQLAAYSWLLDREKNINCAYYLFPKKDFIHERGKDWLSLIQRAVNAYHKRLDDLKDGKLKKGEEKASETSDDILSIAAGCDYCDFKDFCDVLEGENE